ncbi:peptidylprolyl isomerase [Deinococcus sp. YIM 77859]|uniref:peptidylprolyl isomerase n=1 Tax=Deinococcus sp. YIM 77859 TaxID=1540221 RepID=UPI00054D0902|nr:peptidylprolyl isomerase [Deinococcus sp. YIM 77859]
MKQPASLLTALLTAVLLLTSCQKEESGATTDTTGETAQTETTQTDATKTAASSSVTQPGPVPAGYTVVPPLSDKPVRSFKAAPEFTLQDGRDYYALIDTSKGQILVDLYEKETPVTVNNFVTLARHHFYDGTRFHRVIEGFMAQGGDPLSADESKKAQWGTGGPGYSFADEFREKLTFDSPGLLAMANSGPATNGSQFFITFVPTDFLNGKHTIFGKVVQGDDVLPKLTRTMDESNAEIPGAVADKILTVRILTKG